MSETVEPGVERRTPCEGAPDEQDASPATTPAPPTAVTVLHDYVTQRGGAERVALLLAQRVGGGSLTTSAYLPDESHAEFADIQVRELLSATPERLKRSRASLAPLAAAAFARHRPGGDVLLCSSSGFAHWTPPAVPSVVYCYTPPRWFWKPEDFFGHLPPLARRTATAATRAARLADRRRALAPRSGEARRYLAISTCVRDRIQDAYGVEAGLVFPPVSFDPAGVQEPVEGLDDGFVLTIARDRGYKNIAEAQEVFQSGRFGRLVVVGSRRQGRRGHVVNVGQVSEAQLRWLYTHCRAVLALSREDFGLTPVEGHLSGKPTVALRDGGYLDTCVAGVNAVFTASLDPTGIRAALEELDSTTWDPAVIRATADRFSVATFESGIRRALTEVSA